MLRPLAVAVLLVLLSPALAACAPAQVRATESSRPGPAATVWVQNDLLSGVRVYLNRDGTWIPLGHVESMGARCFPLRGHVGRGELVARLVVGGGATVSSPAFSLSERGWTWRLTMGVAGGL